MCCLSGVDKLPHGGGLEFVALKLRTKKQREARPPCYHAGERFGAQAASLSRRALLIAAIYRCDCSAPLPEPILSSL